MYSSLFPILPTTDIALSAAVARILAEPAGQPRGERIARVLDPDGNDLILGEAVKQ